MSDPAAGADAARDSERTKPEDTDFRQQRLRAWQPILTPKWVILTFLIIGIAFIPIGAAVLAASGDVVEVEQRYDAVCGSAATCSVTLDIEDKMEGPVYFYYKLTNFFQNHRRYVKSRSDEQLSGEGSASSSCDPLENWDGKTLYPCGLVANSFFNDKFTAEVELMQDDGTLAPAVPLADSNWDETNIAWASDIDVKFKDLYLPPTPLPSSLTRDGPRGQLPYLNDQHLMVWMRTASLSTFRKLYAVIDRSLPKGSKLTVTVDNAFDSASYDGTKSVVLSTLTWVGGRNTFLGWAYIIVGIVCIVFALAFAIKAAVSPRPLGDMKYFTLTMPGASKAKNA